MSFTLNLGAGGLCVFAHESDGNGSLTRMHVLCPATGSHDAHPGHEHHHEHIPMLVFDPSALFGEPPTGRAELRSLENARIDLSGVSSSTPLTLAEGAADLQQIYGCTVPRDLLADDYDRGDLTTRLTFAAGRGGPAPCGRGGFWKVNGKEQQILIRAVWSMEVDGDELQVHVQGINGSDRDETLVFKPHGGRIDLWLFHSPADQHPASLPPRTVPGNPDAGAPAEHFAAILQMLNCDGPLPTFHRSEHDESRPERLPDCYARPGERAMEVTCIGASAPVVP